MYQRDKLAQDDTYAWEAITPVEPEMPSYSEPTILPPSRLTPAPWVGRLTPSGLEPPSSSGWSSVWSGIAPVIQTGAEAFAKIYGIIKGKGENYPYHPTPPTQIPPGYRYNPITKRIEPIQAGITSSPYFWPAILGIGAFFLVSQGKKR